MKNKSMSYIDSVHHYGRIWNLSMVVLLLMFPAAVSIIFHAPADGKGLLMGLVATAPMYWAVGFIETLTYVPMLGAGGSYLSFVTGNIGNLKLPCALNAGTVGIMVPVSVLFTVGVARILYKKGIL